MVNVLNTYVEKLSKTILQLSYVSSRLKGVFSYSPNEYSNDIDKFSELREDYLGHGEILNELLEVFLITHPTRKK